MNQNCVHSPLKRSSTASCSMCCPKASSRCAISASLHLAAASACLRCAYSSNRNTRRTWKSQKPHRSQPIQPQSQSCAAQAVGSPCFFNAPFDLRDAAHHELLCLSVSTSSLDTGFHACTQVSTRLTPGNIHPNAFFAGSPACAGRLFGCTINTNPPI